MSKIDYFDCLVKISELSEASVILASDNRTEKSRSATAIKLRTECDKLICELEDSLFSDFLPPLERNSIAACAHSLSRVIEKANELSIYQESTRTPLGYKNEECNTCIKLASELKKYTSILKNIRKPTETPDIEGFRKILEEGRAANKNFLKKMQHGTLPSSAMRISILTARLRFELSRAFDDLIEIMLNNI